MSDKRPTGLDWEEVAKLQLRDNELRVLQAWAADPKAGAVAPETAAKMFSLYLQGQSCKEIQQQECFRGFTHGAIVHARVVGRWDEAVAEVRERIRRSVVDRAVHVGQESAAVILDVMACANKSLGAKAKAYLAGETDKLPLPVDAVIHYKALVEMYSTFVDVESRKIPPAIEAPAVQRAELPASQSDRDELRLMAQQARRQMKAPPAEA